MSQSKGPKPNVAGLASRAMLAKLSISLWSARAISVEANAVVASTYKSGEAQTRVTKALIDPGALEGVRSAATRARTAFYEDTVSWADEGKRALLARNFAKFDNKISGIRADFEVQRDSFIRDYPGHVQRAQQDLGGLFTQGEYPDATELMERFSFEIAYEPMPESNDWRVNLGDEEVHRLTNEIEERHSALLGKAQGEIVQKALNSVEAMAAKLSAFNPEASGAERGIFRDSLIANVAEVAASLPGLNIGGDPNIDALAQEIIAKLTTVPADVLRSSDMAREIVTNDAASIIEKMKGMI